jgi:hypothetical protein
MAKAETQGLTLNAPKSEILPDDPDNGRALADDF